MKLAKIILENTLEETSNISERFGTHFTETLKNMSNWNTTVDVKKGELRKQVGDWIITWFHWEKGKGEKTTESNQKEQIEDLRKQLIGYKGKYLQEVEELYTSEFGKGNYTVEYKITKIDDREETIPVSGSRGYRVRIEMIVSPKK